MNRILKAFLSYRNNKNSVVFKSMFRSIVMAIIIPIVIAISISVISLYKMESKMEETKSLVLDRIINEVNRSFTNIYRVNNHIKGNVSVRKYARSTNRDFWEEYKIQEFIKESIEGNTSLEMVYMFFPQYNYVISNLNAAESLRFHSKYYKNTYEVWLKQLSNQRENIIMDQKGFEEENVKNIIISSIEGARGEDAQIALVLQLRESYFEDIISDICLSPDDRVVIYNNEVRLSTFQDEQTKYIFQEIVQSNDKMPEDMTIDKTKYDIVSRYHSKYGFNFIYASPKNPVISSLAFTKWYGIGAIVLCIIFSFILSLTVANENYKPIKKILNLMNHEKRSEVNEYKQIETTVVNYIQHNNDLTITLNQYTIELGKVYLEKILFGKIPHLDSIKEGIKLYNLGLDFKYFAIFLFDFSEKDPDNDSLFFEGDNGIEYLTAAINTYLPFIQTFHILKENDQYICIINGDSENAAYFKNDITDGGEKIKNEIEKLGYLQCNLYVSHIFTEITRLQDEYRELKQEKQDVEITESMEENIDIQNLSIERILAIIKEEAFDCNLSVAGMADMLDVTPAYLSRYFKQQTEVGLLDYIHRFRIIMSKELITENPKIKINEVAKMTGFYNVSALIRVFKKHEGITPGQYRDSI